MKWIPFAVDVKTGINHRVFVKRAEKIEQTAGGLALTGSDKIEQHFGTVIASSSPALEPGDIVLFSRMGGMDIELHGQEPFTVFDEAEILAVQDKEQR